MCTGGVLFSPNKTPAEKMQGENGNHVYDFGQTRA
jgi:hypothetical protein